MLANDGGWSVCGFLDGRNRVTHPTHHQFSNFACTDGGLSLRCQITRTRTGTERLDCAPDVRIGERLTSLFMVIRVWRSMRCVFLLLLSSARLAADQPCVIVATAPPPKGIATWSQAGRAQRHELIFLSGENPSGIPFRSTIKDKDVEKIRAKGGRLLILDSEYTRDDLDKAKKECAKNDRKALTANRSFCHWLRNS